jgi:hypothetical protein
MEKLLRTIGDVERYLGSMKFAVLIIFGFMVMNIYGTFMESYHGTEYANRLVYKSWWFMGTQFLMFLSITIATTLRLPFKKTLYGFYVIHLGLIMTFIGSYVTYMSGIDGSLELVPGTPSNTVVINQDQFKVKNMSTGKAIYLNLPMNAGPVDMNRKVGAVKLLKFLPSSTTQDQWRVGVPSDTTGKYLLYNDNVSQEFMMSMSPKSDYKSSLKMGLLTIHYMPEILFNCFKTQSKSGYLIWNLNTSECFSIESKNIPVDKTDAGNPALTFTHEGKDHHFFPDFSPLPINKDFTKNANSPFRIFSRKLFEDKPNLFIFGKTLAYFKKRGKKWIGKEFEMGKDIKLPWMNFKLKFVDFRKGQYPVKVPTYVIPTQENGKVVEGEAKAALVSAGGQEFWITSEKPLTLQKGNEKISMALGKKLLKLPYQISLNRFKMDKDPGTNNPASYESFVQLLDGRKEGKASEHHVYMNNPLQYDGMTFYQASYFPFGQEDFGSIFSVNFDPGRPLKYLGAILLVLGSIWHYVIRRKNKGSFFQSLKSSGT